MTKKEPFHLTIEAEQKQRIEERAKELGMSTAAFLRQAALKQLEEEKQ